MTVISQLADFVAQANAAALPAAEQALQRRHVFDAVVAAAVGARTAEARSLAALRLLRACLRFRLRRPVFYPIGGPLLARDRVLGIL